jgi:hypothetical protein
MITRHGCAFLEAARAALVALPAFDPFPKGRRVGLEIVVSPPRTGGADPTNLLGGVSDVLEDKQHRGQGVEHLGDLAEVWLYGNDRDVRELRYREGLEPEGRPGHRGTSVAGQRARDCLPRCPMW